jgi:hypothetical protein
MESARLDQQRLDHYVTLRTAASGLGRSLTTLRDRRAWKRLGLTPRLICGRWMVAVSEIRRKQDGAA